ncbi:ParA family protein [Natronomonas sp. EA1]|uniref:ParA family protein n=1 Tax=Natronomonas sp. EA1 TaxID=3421655 RepID=UPI003EC13C99
MSTHRTLAFVGATGGAGTTRLTLETASLLSEVGDVCVVDAAFDTQGMARYLPDRLDPDATQVALGEASLEEALVAFEGVDVCAARAPVERLARAKTPEAGERYGRIIEGAADAYDFVLVDVPPVASNPAFGALDAVAARAIVAPARAPEALARTRDRLADIEAYAAHTVLTRTDEGPADVTLPEAPSEVPAETGAFATALRKLTNELFGTEFTVESSDGFSIL